MSRIFVKIEAFPKLQFLEKAQFHHLFLQTPFVRCGSLYRAPVI
jgi:hypothetical protein